MTEFSEQTLQHPLKSFFISNVLLKKIHDNLSELYRLVKTLTWIRKMKISTPIHKSIYGKKPLHTMWCIQSRGLYPSLVEFWRFQLNRSLYATFTACLPRYWHISLVIQKSHTDWMRRNPDGWVGVAGCARHLLQNENDNLFLLLLISLGNGNGKVRQNVAVYHINQIFLINLFGE